MIDKEKFNSFPKKEENTIEKEPKPEKIALIIRHPSVEWFNTVLEKAEQEGKDIETYTPIDKKGLKMTRLLSEYFKNNLSQLLNSKEFKEFSIYTSPIKRAKSEAEIISKNLKLAHLDNSNIPIPKNSKPIENESFGEVPWIDNKQEALDLAQEAEQKGVHILKVWFEKNPDEIVEKINKKLPDIERGLDTLDNSETPMNIIFTHRLTGTLMLWVVKQRNEGRKDLTITKDDLSEIMNLTGSFAYTSISEIRKEKDKLGEWNIHSIGKTPHLDEEPELRQGTF